MEKENKLKAETSFENSTFSLPNIFDSIPYETEKDSLDFLETMFGVYNQDYTTTSSIFDLLCMPYQPEAMSFTNISTVQESCEVVNTPATPNLSCISSSSTEVADDEQNIRTLSQQDEEQDQDKYKKQLRPKKKNLKIQREPRFAFMTKSEIDHLDDGFRWRKYGQKAVKNSHFPRSYYRCTTVSCGVKKRVERSLKDTSIVVTTYEGTHTHTCPTRPSRSIGFPSEFTTYGGAIGGDNIGEGTYNNAALSIPQHYYPSTNLPLNLCADYNSSLFTFNSLQEGMFTPSHYSSSLARDNGLLHDMVPSQIRSDLKEEYVGN